MIKTLVLISIAIGCVVCGTDLCQNNIKLDSIAYIDTEKMYFFTSGGHYWYVEEGAINPLLKKGKPLEPPLTRVDAAFYKNTFDACRGVSATNGQQIREREIHLIEFINGQNMVVKVDIRQEWAWGQPKRIDAYNDLRQARIETDQQIDAVFAYKETNIVVVQGQKYSIVDITNLCRDTNAFGTAVSTRDISDWNHQSAIQAMTFHKDQLILFSDDSYWLLTNIKLFASQGKITAQKDGAQKDPAIDFFGLDGNCNDPSADSTSSGIVPGGQPSTTDPGSAETLPEDSKENKDNNPDNGYSGLAWIIIIIIIVIILVLVIAFCVCLAVRKKDQMSDSAETGKAAEVAAAVGTATQPNALPSDSSKAGADQPTGSKDAPKVVLKEPMQLSGSSPSMMSVRSQTAVTSTPKGGSKANK